MAATWSISSTEWYTAPIEQDDVEYADVIFTLHWQVTDSETDGDNTYSGRVYGSQSLDISDLAEGWSDYDDVTEEEALGWLSDALGEEAVEQYEANVAKQIEDAKNPPVESGLPWATVEAVADDDEEEAA